MDSNLVILNLALQLAETTSERDQARVESARLRGELAKLNADLDAIQKRVEEGATPHRVPRKSTSKRASRS